MSDLFTLDWDGKHYELDVESITAREFKQIRNATDMKAGPFIQSLNSLADLDGDVAVALLWLFHTRAGEPATFDDEVSVVRLLAALGRNVTSDEAEPDPKAEAEVDPPTTG